MKRYWIYLVWTIPWLFALGFVNHLKKHAVPENCLLSNFSSSRFVNEFKNAKPTIDFWKTNSIDNVKFDDFSLLAVDKIYAYLSDADITELKEYYSPAIIESYVRRVKTILVSPCSFELKEKVIKDPLCLSKFVKNYFFTTNKLNSLFIFTHGKNEAELLFNAEKEYKQLGELKAENKISQIQSMCGFLVSPEKQILAIEKFNITIDVFKWLAEFQKSVKNENLRIDIFSSFIENLRAIKDNKKEMVIVAEQKKLIEKLDIPNFDNYFLYRTELNNIYSVTRVSIPENVSAKEVRENILKKIQSRNNYSFVTGESYFSEKYYSYLNKLFLDIFIFGAIGFVFIFISKLTKEFVEKLIFGKSADYFFVNKNYALPLLNNNLKKFEDFILIEKVAAGNKNIDVDIIRKHRKRSGGARRRIDKISILNNGRFDKKSYFFIKRGTGRKVKAIKREADAIMRMKRKGLATPEIAVYGEGNWRGLKQTFFVMPELKGYKSFYDLQISGKIDNKFKLKFVKKLATVVKKCHKNNIYNVQWFSKHIFVKTSNDGTVKLKLIDLEDVFPQSIKNMYNSWINPLWSKTQKSKELVHLNTQFFSSIFSLKDRIYFYKCYSGKSKLTKKDKRFISKIFILSNMKRYSQYTTKASGIFINLEREEIFNKLPLKTFNDFMEAEGKETITKKRGRTVVTLEYEKGRKLFLKRHTKTNFFDSLKEFFRYGKPQSNAALEWNAISELKNYGIETMPVLAMGEMFRLKFWEKKSFLITEEIKDGVSVESILAKCPNLSFKIRRNLAEKIGEIGRKLHTAGFVHRDFYLGHFYVVGNLDDEYKLHLIDLQRIMPGAKIFNRWSLKDISALYFSSLPLREISKTDRLRFLFNYLGIKTFDKKSKKFLKNILKKAHKIEKHTDKLIKRRIKRGELPSRS